MEGPTSPVQVVPGTPGGLADPSTRDRSKSVGLMHSTGVEVTAGGGVWLNVTPV